MSYIPDQIQQWESAAEDWYFDAVQPDGKLKCECGNVFDEKDGNTLTPHPYAPLACPECVQKAMDACNLRSGAQNQEQHSAQREQPKSAAPQETQGKESEA